MPQTAKSTKNATTNRTSSRGGTASRSSNSSKNGSTSRSTSRRAGTNRSRAKQSSSSRARPRPSSSAKAKSGSASFASSAVEKTKAAAGTVSEVASRAKTPLIVIAGGTALVGVAAGALVKDRLDRSRSKGPIARLRGVSLPKAATDLDLSKLDLEKVKSAADRISAYGQQASDIASAAEKTRKKNK